MPCWVLMCTLMYLKEPSSFRQRCVQNIKDQAAWYLFGELVGMATVGIDLTERSRGFSVAEQVHELMDALGVTSVEARMAV